MLTAEQKKNYLKHTEACPYCGTTELDINSISFEEDEIWQDIGCIICKKTWTNVYKIVDVLPV